MSISQPVIAAIACLAAAASLASDIELDPFTGLKKTGDWELVRNNCIPCHSARLITQQNGTADQWLAMIRWMQKKQNLWQFSAEDEARIIAYLAENYPPRENQRRAPLPPEQMPPNPYSRESAVATRK